MKTAKNFTFKQLGISILMVVATILCTSCSKYQYLSISSGLDRTPNNAFYIENDTVRITYRFDGYHCPVKIEIYNKLRGPLYVDWHKSSAIVDGRRMSYLRNEERILLETSGLEMNENRTFTTTSGTIAGTVKRHEQLSYIPPNSYVTQMPVRLCKRFVEVPTLANRNRTHLKANPYGVKKSVYSFDSQNSPLNFRSHLVLSTTEDFAAPIYFDNEFWAAEVYSSRLSPGNTESSGANQTYIVDPFKHAGAVVILSILVAPVLLSGFVMGN